MAYQVYTIAPTKATWESGFPLPPQYLSLQADAQKVADGVKGVLSNGAVTFAGTPLAFVLDPADLRQPWIVTVNGSWSFAGLSIYDPTAGTGMYAPNKVNGGGIGNPGDFAEDPVTRLFSWVPTAPPPTVVLPVPAATGPTNAEVWASAVMGVTTLTPQAYDTETLYWQRAIGARLGIPAPPAS